MSTTGGRAAGSLVPILEVVFGSTVGGMVATEFVVVTLFTTDGLAAGDICPRRGSSLAKPGVVFGWVVAGMAAGVGPLMRLEFPTWVRLRVLRTGLMSRLNVVLWSAIGGIKTKRLDAVSLLTPDALAVGSGSAACVLIMSPRIELAVTEDGVVCGVGTGPLSRLEVPAVAASIGLVVSDGCGNGDLASGPFGTSGVTVRSRTWVVTTSAGMKLVFSGTLAGFTPGSVLVTAAGKARATPSGAGIPRSACHEVGDGRVFDAGLSAFVIGFPADAWLVFSGRLIAR